MPKYLEGFGQLLEAARIKKGYSREKLGEVVSASPKHIYNIEHKQAVLSISLLKRLVYALDIPPTLVFYPTDESADSKADEISRAIRRMDERELAIVKDMTDSILRNRISSNVNSD